MKNYQLMLILCASFTAQLRAETIDNNVSILCQLKSVKEIMGNKLIADYTPNKLINIELEDIHVESMKCLRIPLNDDATMMMAYPCLHINDKTLLINTAEKLQIREGESKRNGNNWGLLTVDFKSGDGRYNVDVRYGWKPFTKDHDRIEVSLVNCIKK